MQVNTARSRAERATLDTLGYLKGTDSVYSQWYRRHPGQEPCPTCEGRGHVGKTDWRRVKPAHPLFVSLSVGSHLAGPAPTRCLVEIQVEVRDELEGPERVGLDVRDLEYERFEHDKRDARFRWRGCTVRHKPSGLSVTYTGAVFFKQNRVVAEKQLAEKVAREGRVIRRLADDAKSFFDIVEEKE